jgi:amino acid adenylation domain-containing protein
MNRFVPMTLSEVDRAGVVPSAFDGDEALHRRFERMAALHPLREAVGAGEWRPSYAQLNASANRLAHAVIRGTRAEGDRVIILSRHDATLICAMLAVLKAGRVVVVVNPTESPQRLRQFIDHAEANLILTDSPTRDLAAQAAGSDCTVLAIEEEEAQVGHANLGLHVNPDTLAFLVYTSGSTGAPKAVMRTHRQVLVTSELFNQVLAITENDRIALLYSLGSNAGVAIAWCALASGAAICPFPAMDVGAAGLEHWIKQSRVTYLNVPATLFRQLVSTIEDKSCVAGIRAVRIGSEQASSEDFDAFKRLFPAGSVLMHTLAASEAPQGTYLLLTTKDSVASGRLPVGSPFEGTEIRIVDPEGRPVAPGETGEIIVRARHLSSGYWRNDALTAAKYADDPAGDGWRLCRTGDLGRINEAGLLEWIGRKDARVKIRGNLVDLPELENVVTAIPGIERAAACVFDLPYGRSVLVAYAVVRNPANWSAGELSRSLREVLPRHAIPSNIFFLDRLPLTGRGTIDRVKLQQIYAAAQDRRLKEGPVTETEIMLAAVWADLFEIAEIGRLDDFFALGGDSLNAAVVAAAVQSRFGIAMNLGMFGQAPVLCQLAALIDDLRSAGKARDAPAISHASRNQPLPLSFAQERVWIDSQTLQNSRAYVSSVQYRVEGRLNVEALRESMNIVAQRHEILRTSFSEGADGPVQHIEGSADAPFSYVDLAGRNDADEHVCALLDEDARRGLHITEPSLMRTKVIRLRPNEHMVSVLTHHIVSDGWSWQNYLRELAEVYQAKVEGEDIPPSRAGPLQYADYAAWQRQALAPTSSAYASSLAWWVEVLKGARAWSRLPFQRSRPVAGLAPEDGLIAFEIDRPTLNQLETIGRSAGSSGFIVRLAAFVALLAAEAGRFDVIIGTYLPVRRRREFLDMLGNFTNLVALRFLYRDGLTFREWLAVVRDRFSEAEQNSEIPYERLRSEFKTRRLRWPAITAIFHATHRTSGIAFAGLKFTHVYMGPITMPWGFTISSLGTDFGALFDPHLHDPDKVRRFADCYRRLLHAIARSPDAPTAVLLAESGARRPGWSARKWRIGF